MTAASTRDVSATQTLKACRVTIFWTSVSLANGPVPCTADQIATPEVIRAAGGAPPGGEGPAGGMSRGKNKESRGRVFLEKKKGKKASPAQRPPPPPPPRPVRAPG